MKFLKISGAVLLSFAAMALLVPGSAFAAKGHVKPVRVEVGTISGYTAGSSVVINGVSIKLKKHTKLVAEDAAAAAAKPLSGDEGVAFVRWHKGVATAKKLEYGSAGVNFAYVTKEFAGRYESSTTVPPTTLTIVIKGKKPVTLTFNTTTTTKYYDNGKQVISPAYLPNERTNVRGEEFTDGKWYAAVVRLTHNTKGKG
jgi:hypothetical protein